MTEFKEFRKIPRLTREMVITEKIDGTNASIYIGEDGEFLIGSRTKWITPEADNHGFARWAVEHKDDLLELGVGHHFGEFWGPGIQRGYGLKDKTFSLFNVHKWAKHGKELKTYTNQDPKIPTKFQVYPPKCCDVVPVLYEGIFDTCVVDSVLQGLDTNGSTASPGFMRPEGIVIFHTAGNLYFKRTLENDNEPKGKS